METPLYKKARSSRGWCEICHHWVHKGEYYTTSGTDGHGALTGLVHQTCVKADAIKSGASYEFVRPTESCKS